MYKTRVGEIVGKCQRHNCLVSSKPDRFYFKEQYDVYFSYREHQLACTVLLMGNEVTWFSSYRNQNIRTT